MKIRGTLFVAALALVVGAFPAFAQQQSTKSAERQKMDRKIDAAAKTPYLTPHQGESIKRAVDGGDRMKAEESTAYPTATNGLQANPSQPQAPQTQTPGEQTSAPGEQAPTNPEPAPEPEKPAYHLMGTVCGKGPDLATFDVGEDWPVRLKVGDKVDEETTVKAIDHGSVVLERVTMVTPPAPPTPPATAVKAPVEGQQSVPAAPPAPPKPVEKRERFQVYAW
jgi:hypothetical protein